MDNERLPGIPINSLDDFKKHILGMSQDRPDSHERLLAPEDAINAWNIGHSEASVRGEPMKLNAIMSVAKAQLAQDEARFKASIAEQIYCDVEDAVIFDTSYGYNQVKVTVFMNEDSEIWQALKGGEK